jgi:hypothetical protein
MPLCVLGWLADALIVGERWYPEVLASVLEELARAKENKSGVQGIAPVVAAPQPVEAH